MSIEELFPLPGSLSCGCQGWEHDLYDGVCPETLPPVLTDCCGRPVRGAKLISRRCSHGCCLDFYCACGVHAMAGFGPAACPCGHDDWPDGHGSVGERKKLPTPDGREYTRRQRARRNRR